MPAAKRRIQIDLPAVHFDFPADADILTVPDHAPPLTEPAAVGALPVLVDGGTLIQIANSSDGIGAAEYRHELDLLRQLPRYQDYITALLQRLVVQKDQWEVEMWCKVLEKVGGPDHLIYCTVGIPPDELEKLPLTSGYAYTGERELSPMVQHALQRVLTSCQQRLGRPRRLGLILDGIHAIPVLTTA